MHGPTGLHRRSPGPARGAENVKARQALPSGGPGEGPRPPLARAASL